MDWLNYVILAIYVLMLVLIAYFTRKKSKSLNDFFLAGKGLGGWMTAFAYGTTYFSAVVFIGYAGKFGWNFGLASLWIAIGNAFIGSFIAWKVLARRTRNLTNRLGAKTMPEFFEARYKDPKIKLVSSLIIFFFLIPYSASVYQGLGYLFEMVFGIDFIWCILLMAALTALYLFFGGYFATAVSDFLQGIIMLVGVVVMVVFVVRGAPVSLSDMFAHFAESGNFLPSAAGGFFDSPLVNIIALTLLTSFGVWGLPQIVHKFYAIRNEKSIRQATVVSTMFALVIGLCAYFTGCVAKFYFAGQGGGMETPVLPSGGTDYDKVVPNVLATALPAGFLGLIVVLVLSASMSTLASLSLSGSSAVAVDLYKGYLNRRAGDKQVSLVLRVTCLVFVVVSAVLAITQFEAIVSLMSLSWGTLAGCFVGPYVYGLYSKKVTRSALWTSVVGGLAVTLGCILLFGFLRPAGEGLGGVLKGGLNRSPMVGVIAMAFSMIATPLVSALDRRKVEGAEELLEGVNQKIE